MRKRLFRSTITVFPMRKPGVPDFRIWNTFIIGYAGYKNADGSILGHSINVELTEVYLSILFCESLSRQCYTKKCILNVYTYF